MASKKKAAAPVEAVEAVKTGGLGLEDGIVLGTGILTLIAIVLVHLASQAYA
ncbi:MAG: hypothetical protein RIT25_507 [Planctomycetota bacterium]|jgi:hypothetical protein